MEAQKTITIAYDVRPYRVSEISGNTNESNVIFTDILSYLSWSVNVDGRFALALEQYLKHTKKIDEIRYFLCDETYDYETYNNTLTLAGAEGKINVSEIDF